MDQQQFPAPIAWWDTETTGLGPVDQIRILEVAVIQMKGDTLKETCQYETLVDPEVEIPPGSTKYHGIVKRHIEGKPTFKRIAHKLHMLLDQHVWAGHNIAAYDIPLLKEEFRRAGMEMPRCLGIIDTLQIARKHWRGRLGTKTMSLEDLGFHFELFPPGAKQTHRALGDVRLNIDVAKGMFARLALENLFEFMQPTWLDVVPPTPPHYSQQPEGEKKEEPVVRLFHTTHTETCTAKTKQGKGPRCRNHSVNTEIGLCALHAGMALCRQGELHK